MPKARPDRQSATIRTVPERLLADAAATLSESGENGAVERIRKIADSVPGVEIKKSRAPRVARRKQPPAVPDHRVDKALREAPKSRIKARTITGKASLQSLSSSGRVEAYRASGDLRIAELTSHDGFTFGGGLTLDLERAWTAFSSDYRILSIDGGGARGMIPATILKEIEERSGRPISSIFDRIAGTSTGSILTVGLTARRPNGTPRYTAADIVQMYHELGEVIFQRGSFQDRVLDNVDFLQRNIRDNGADWLVWHKNQAKDAIMEIINNVQDPLHNIDRLAVELFERLGDRRLSEARCEAFTYMYDIGSRTPQVMGSRESTIPGTRDFSDYRMWQAATASSAAVPFFAPMAVWENPVDPEVVGVPGMVEIPVARQGSGEQDIMVDGGNAGIGNPSLLALADENQDSQGRSKVLLSLGTGHFNVPMGPEASGWGFLEWIGTGELLTNLFDGASDATDMTLRSLVGDELTYHRWQPAIPSELNFLDEGSATDMQALADIAQGWIDENDELIDAFIESVPDRVRFIA